MQVMARHIQVRLHFPLYRRSGSDGVCCRAALDSLGVQQATASTQSNFSGRRGWAGVRGLRIGMAVSDGENRTLVNPKPAIETPRDFNAWVDCSKSPRTFLTDITAVQSVKLYLSTWNQSWCLQGARRGAATLFTRIPPPAARRPVGS